MFRFTQWLRPVVHSMHMMKRDPFLLSTRAFAVHLAYSANSSPGKVGQVKGIMKDDGSLFKSFEIYSNGEIVQKICSMSTLITEYSLHGRDFLAIHPGTHRSTPCILARDKAILVNLNTIRCIISSESMIMFNVAHLSF